MADHGCSKIKAQGAAAITAASRLVVTAWLLYLAVAVGGCLDSGSSSQKVLQLPPWSIIRKLQCNSGTPAESPLSKRGQLQPRGRTEVSESRDFKAPCACDTELTILDLGSSSFPRYLPSVDCRGATAHCLKEGRCRQRRYNVRVLRHRSRGEDGSEDPKDIVEDDSLPESLRSAWRFEERPINVACECIP